MTSPPGYHLTSSGRKGGTTRIPTRRLKKSINGGMSNNTQTLNGNPATTRIATMKPRKAKK